MGRNTSSRNSSSRRQSYTPTLRRCSKLTLTLPAVSRCTSSRLTHTRRLPPLSSECCPAKCRLLNLCHHITPPHSHTRPLTPARSDRSNLRPSVRPLISARDWFTPSPLPRRQQPARPRRLCPLSRRRPRLSPPYLSTRPRTRPLHPIRACCLPPYLTARSTLLSDHWPYAAPVVRHCRHPRCSMCRSHRRLLVPPAHRTPTLTLTLTRLLTPTPTLTLNSTLVR